MWRYRQGDREVCGDTGREIGKYRDTGRKIERYVYIQAESREIHRDTGREIMRYGEIKAG